MGKRRRKAKGQVAQSWFSAKHKQMVLLSVFGAVGLFLLGGLLLYVTFWVTYGITSYCVHWFMPLSHMGLSVWSIVFIGLLFWGNHRTDRSYLDRAEAGGGLIHGLMIMVSAMDTFGNAQRLTRSEGVSSGTFVRLCVTVLYSGPRCIVGAVRLIRRWRFLTTLDVPGCCDVLAVLLANPGRVPFEKLGEECPNTDTQRACAALMLIDGVVNLPSKPAGLTLTDTLREQIATGEV